MPTIDEQIMRLTELNSSNTTLPTQIGENTGPRYI